MPARDECGVFGIYAPGLDVARMTFFSLYALQHRGQESAGIATSDGMAAYIHKGMGLVSQVFDEENLRPLEGHLAVGHTRYSTTGSSHLRNAQPYLIETTRGPLGVAHNGNLTNAGELRQTLLERGVGLSSGSDSEVITQILAAPPEVWGGDPSEDRWVRCVRGLMGIATGAYSLAILTRDAIYGVRDPLGMRPLCLGELEGGKGGSGWAVASESCALQTVGARHVRSVEPGEIVRLDRNGITSFPGPPQERRALCLFEYVYLARPDSMLEGQVVHQVRRRLGRELAREAPAEADVVVAVPDSATSAAIGYSLESGIPFTEGLIKNRYIGRTFIQPDNHLRQLGVRLKYNPLPSNLQGRRVVLIDDSIVRGNTAGPILDLLREGGAEKIHVRVASSPIRHPCFMGVDMATRDQLVAAQLDLEGIKRRIGADSLAYLSLEGMTRAVGATQSTHCTACFTGHYPVPIPHHLMAKQKSCSKGALEGHFAKEEGSRMKVLVVGSGGREHALAWALAGSESVRSVLVSPGNGGTQWDASPGRAPSLQADVSAEDVQGLVELARAESVDLTVVGPEAPLASGLVDRFREAGLRVFGPTQAAARIEASKAFAKEVMEEAQIPTARYRTFSDFEEARQALGSFGWPVVIKADGLAAGKGVVVTWDPQEAERTLREMMIERRYGGSGRTVVLEEHLCGRELSVMAFCDGKRAALMPSARDHKRLLDGDAGPNTGGMGAFSPVPEISADLLDQVRRTVFLPALQALERRGAPFVGFLYAGLMLTPDGPRVLEFNCRFGDPEAQVILPLFEGDLARVLVDCTLGRLDPTRVRWSRASAAAVVLASPGYPDDYPRGLPIEGAERSEPGVLVFHAGTRRANDRLLTAGGRVLTVTGLGDDLSEAIDRAYGAASAIRFEGVHFRRDIGAGHRAPEQPTLSAGSTK